MSGLFQGPVGGLRVLLALAVVGAAACVGSDPDVSEQLVKVARSAQPFSSLSNGKQACFKMCSWLQSYEFRETAVERCKQIHEVCEKAAEQMDDPMLAVEGFVIRCHPAELAACQSGADCAAFGAHQCEEACEEAWPDELRCMRDWMRH